MRCLQLVAATVLVMLVGAPVRSSSQEAVPRERWEVLEERLAEGEQCLVCRQLIHDGDIVEVRYKGRTFHVAAKMLDEFKADPDRYFYAMQARSGLFDEASTETPQMSMGWLGFGTYVLLGLIFGAICGYAALNRGLPGMRWFMAGFIGGVFGLIAFFVTQRGARRLDGDARGLSKIPVTSSPVDCPTCGESNHPTAPACSACGRSLNPTAQPETARA